MIPQQTWRQRVQSLYKSVGELNTYDVLYGIVKRCGRKSVVELWKQNPIIGGSTDPESFGPARAQKLSPVAREDIEVWFPLMPANMAEDIGRILNELPELPETK